MSYGYDGANRVESVKHLGANGATIQQYGYGFDKNGNRVSENITRNGVTRRVGTFTYDEVNRLKKVTFGPKTTEYFYDEVGNRVEERDLQAGKTRIFTHDDANRLTGVTENGVGIASYVWDAAGNVTQATESGVTWFYSYDLRQQMTTVRKQATTGPPTFAGEYEYDYAKRRIGRNGVWNVYDGDDLLNEFSSAPSTQNSALNSYTYGNELIRSTRDGNSFADAQGSVTLTDNGTQKFSEYGAFGEVITTDHEESHIGYTGQFFDNETGLMPLGNGERYYSPLLGRFLQEDSNSRFDLFGGLGVTFFPCHAIRKKPVHCRSTV